MAMTPYGGDPLVISKLGTTPQERGLSPEQFKGKFDEGLKAFAEWFNLTHKTEFEAKAEQADLEDLAGAERTIETVKGNADAIEAHMADYVRQPAFGSTGGAANTYTFSSNPPLPALVDGVSTYLDIHAANTGVSTLNWDGKGAKPIVTGKGAALTAGKLPLNGIVGVRYNASAGNFQLLGEGGDERQGDNAALALSISGTTLKLRAPAGLYDGVDDNVTHTDANRIAANIKKDVPLDGLIGALVPLTTEKRWSSGTITFAGTGTAYVWREYDYSVDSGQGGRPYFTLPSNLEFTPSTFIIFRHTPGTGMYIGLYRGDFNNNQRWATITFNNTESAVVFYQISSLSSNLYTTNFPEGEYTYFAIE